MHFHLIFFFILISFSAISQDREYVIGQVEKLASPEFHGRGYVKNGGRKAARYIATQLKKTDVLPLAGQWYQTFTFPVNTFPGDVEIELNGKELKAGNDFIVAPGCPSIEGEFNVLLLDSSILKDSAASLRFSRQDFSDVFVLLDDRGLDKVEQTAFRTFLGNPFRARGILLVRDKLTWSVSEEQAGYPLVEILRTVLPPNIRTIEIDVEAKLIADFDAKNVAGYIPGTVSPDSFVVFTAHYDHLGRMGEALFAGASDNASGVATLLDLARYYSANPLPCSVAFIFFAGEEAGLIGSRYYTEQPLFPLEKIKVLINLDLMGNGSEGIMVVNGSVFPDDFRIMQEINEEGQLLASLGERGKAANSDHYFFTEKGVKSFFIYTLGGSKHYHDVYDVPGTIGFDDYEDIFRLLTTYVERVK